jgi:hypothetical protein
MKHKKDPNQDIMVHVAGIEVDGKRRVIVPYEDWKLVTRFAVLYYGQLYFTMHGPGAKWEK